LKKTIATALALIALTGCAKDPDDILAADIGDNAYKGYSCKQLTEQGIASRNTLNALTAQQKNAANNDALSMLLLGLPIASMAGADKEAQIAIAKGQIVAVSRERYRKGCK